MRRSVILITVILVLCLSLGIWMDVSQQQVARKYLDSVRLIRELADGGQQAQAYDEQRYLHAKWQHDAVWLNYLISHHHTLGIELAQRDDALPFTEQVREDTAILDGHRFVEIGDHKLHVQRVT